MSLEVKQMLEKERTFLETQEREYMEKEKERSREKREPPVLGNDRNRDTDSARIDHRRCGEYYLLPPLGPYHFQSKISSTTLQTAAIELAAAAIIFAISSRPLPLFICEHRKPVIQHLPDDL